jgi:hypothetical protein
MTAPPVDDKKVVVHQKGQTIVDRFFHIYYKKGLQMTFRIVDCGFKFLYRKCLFRLRRKKWENMIMP